jgi:hypothetical protein
MRDRDDFGSDILDMRDLIARRNKIPPNRDAYQRDDDDSEFLVMFEELEQQLWTDIEEIANGYDPTLIRDSYFVTYAQDYAEDIGAISRDLDWPASHIDWDSAADSLKTDFTEFSIGSYTYYGRAG